MDPRLVSANRRQTEMFQRAAALMTLPAEVLRIPYEGTTLPGYFVRASADDTPRAPVLLTGGYDGSCEELYFFNAAAALRRGYHVLAFDGPGQGEALLQQGFGHPGGLGERRWPRARLRLRASGCRLRAHRLGRAEPRRVPCSPGRERRAPHCRLGRRLRVLRLVRSLPGPATQTARHGLRRRLSPSPRGPRAALNVLARRPTAGWALRRGQHVHGVGTHLAYLDALRDFSMAGHAERITCPTWVCNAEGDDIGASAPQLVNALTVDKRLRALHRRGGRRGPLRGQCPHAVPRPVLRLAGRAAASLTGASSRRLTSPRACPGRRRRPARRVGQGR